MDGERMQVTCTLASNMHTYQNLVNTQCWTLYLHWTDKHVKTKNACLLN